MAHKSGAASRDAAMTAFDKIAAIRRVSRLAAEEMCELALRWLSKKYTCQTVATGSYIVLPHP